MLQRRAETCWGGVQCHTKLLPEHWGCQEPDLELCRGAECQGHAVSPKQWVQTQHLTTRGLPHTHCVAAIPSKVHQKPPWEAHSETEMPKAPAALCCTAREGVQPWLASSYGPAATRAVGQAAATPMQELAAHCSPGALPGTALSHGGLKADHHRRHGYPSCAQERPNPTAQLLWNCPWPPCAFPWLLAISLGGDGERQG